MELKYKQNPRGKPGLVCFPSDTGRLIHLSAGQQPKTQGQMHTGVAYQDDIECSEWLSYNFNLNQLENPMARLENGYLTMINNRLKNNFKKNDV